MSNINYQNGFAAGMATNGIVSAGSNEVVEQIQADWLQTDDTQPDYIKNRPFYSEETSGYISLKSTHDSNPRSLELRMDHLVLGETSDITFILDDGTQVVRTVDVISTETAGLSLDPPRPMLLYQESTDDLSIMFYIISNVIFDENVDTNSGFVYHENMSTYYLDGPASVKVFGQETIHHEIDENYLPASHQGLPETVQQLLKDQEETSDTVRQLSNDRYRYEVTTRKSTTISRQDDNYVRGQNYPTVGAVMSYVDQSVEFTPYIDSVEENRPASSNDYKCHLDAIENFSKIYLYEFIYDTAGITVYVSGNSGATYETSQDGHLDVVSYAKVPYPNNRDLSQDYYDYYFVVPVDETTAKLVRYCSYNSTFIDVDVTFPRLRGAHLVYYNEYFYLLGGAHLLEGGNTAGNSCIYRIPYDEKTGSVGTYEMIEERIPFATRAAVVNGIIHVNTSSVDVRNSDNVKMIAGGINDSNYQGLAVPVLNRYLIAANSYGDLEIHDKSVGGKGVIYKFDSPCDLSTVNGMCCYEDDSQIQLYMRSGTSMYKIIISHKLLDIYSQDLSNNSLIDYDSSDISSPSHIKNRPFYEETIVKLRKLLAVKEYGGNVGYEDRNYVPLNYLGGNTATSFSSETDSTVMRTTLMRLKSPVYNECTCNAYQFSGRLDYYYYTNEGTSYYWNYIYFDEVLMFRGSLTEENTSEYAGNKYLITGDSADDTGENMLIVFPSDNRYGPSLYIDMKDYASYYGSPYPSKSEFASYRLSAVDVTHHTKKLDSKFIPDYISKTETANEINSSIDNRLVDYINSNVTSEQIPTAKSVYDYIDEQINALRAELQNS